MLPLFEDAAKEVADEVTRPRSDGNEEVQNIQVYLRKIKEEKYVAQNSKISNYKVKIVQNSNQNFVS